MLHAPSTLYLPESNDTTGFRFTFNRRSDPPRPLITTTPMVTVEMVDEGSSSPPSSPITAQDKSLLSPPRRSTFRPKETPKVAIPPRPFSAPPGRTFGFVDSPDRSSFRPQTPGSVGSRSTPTTPEVVRPPTILCRCLSSFSGSKEKACLTVGSRSPSEAFLEAHPALSRDWNVLRVVPSSHSPLDVHSCRTSV